MFTFTFCMPFSFCLFFIAFTVQKYFEIVRLSRFSSKYFYALISRLYLKYFEKGRKKRKSGLGTPFSCRLRRNIVKMY